MYTKIAFNDEQLLRLFSQVSSMCSYFILLLFILVILCSGIYASGFIDGSDYGNWIAYYPMRAPSYPLISFVVFYGLICFLIRGLRFNIASNIACSSILLITYLAFEINPLGDHDHWVGQSSEKVVWLSELLSNLTYSIFHIYEIDIKYVAPAFGAITCFIYFILGNKLLPDSSPVYFYFLYRLNFLATGFCILYYFGYIENTLLSIPFTLLYVYFSIRFLERKNAALSQMVFASIFLGIACLFHGQNTFLLPSACLFIIFDGLKNKRTARIIVRNILIIIISVLLLVGGVIFGVLFAGYGISSGNISGGGDAKMFVPVFSYSSTIYTRFLMFSFEHLFDISNILMHCSPVAIVLSVFLIGLFLKGGFHTFSKRILSEYNPILLVLGVLFFCYFIFIFLWNFDLGFPVDLDLMVSLGFLVGLFSFHALYNFSGSKKTWLSIAVFLGVLFNTYFAGFFLTFRL